MRVAIAGCGGLTRYICEEFEIAGHELIILTRSHKSYLADQKVTQFVTDYSLSSLKGPLVDCEALISTIADESTAYTDVHRTLILACQQSPKCKRFIPAEFAANIDEYPDQPGFYYGPHEPIRRMLREQKELEWSLVCIGWLADYFVPAKNRYIKNIGQFHPVDWETDEMVIPGTGNEPVDFTWARDVVRALASLLKAPPGSWGPYTFIAGERSCWNDAVKLVQQDFRPHTQTRHLSLHAVVEMLKSAKDKDTLVLADYCFLSISHACASAPDNVQSHKEKYFPEVHFRTIQEGLSEYCKLPNSIL